MSGHSDTRGAGGARGLVAERVAATPAPEVDRESIPRALALKIYELAREAYPEECCGILVGPEGALPTRVVACSNVQSRRQARGESELDATQAFWMDDRELLDAIKQADRDGQVVRAIYHSHPEAPAYLSHQDVDAALGPTGSPHYPGALQIVVSVRGGIVREAAVYAWDAARGCYRGRLLEGGGRA